MKIAGIGSVKLVEMLDWESDCVLMPTCMLVLKVLLAELHRPRTNNCERWQMGSIKNSVASEPAETAQFRLVDVSGRATELEKNKFDEASGDYVFNQAALATEEKFTLVLQNYVQFESTLTSITLNHFIFGNPDWSNFIDEIQLVNGSLLNLLSSTKAYLDQVPQHLNDIYGAGSNEARAFAKATNQEFDARFEYRIISALRNHLQHNDFPVKWLEFSNSWSQQDGGNDTCSHKLVVSLSVDDLVRNEHVRSDTRKELGMTGQTKLDVKPLVRAYISSIARLHSSVRTLMDQKAQSAEERVRALIKSAEDDLGKRVLGLCVEAICESGEVSAKIPVFAENIERRRHLIKRSHLITNLEKHFVSSEVATK